MNPYFGGISHPFGRPSSKRRVISYQRLETADGTNVDTTGKLAKILDEASSHGANVDTSES